MADEKEKQEKLIPSYSNSLGQALFAAKFYQWNIRKLFNYDHDLLTIYGHPWPTFQIPGAIKIIQGNHNGGCIFALSTMENKFLLCWTPYTIKQVYTLIRLRCLL